MKMIDIQKQMLEQFIAESTDPIAVMYAQEKLRKLGSPIVSRRYAAFKHEAVVEDYNLTNNELYMDISAVNFSIDDIAKRLTDDFNNNTTELRSIEQQLKNLSSTVTDLALISSENEYNTVYFKDSFVNKDNLDKSTGTPSTVLMNEGIAILNVTELKKFPCSIFSVQGNGESGNYHVVKQGKKLQPYLSGYEFVSDYNSNSDNKGIVDGEPNTWYEYQAANIKNSSMPPTPNTYNLDWLNTTGLLRMKLVVQLDQVQTINWLALNPYYPDASRRKVKVNNIRISEDGIDYEPINSQIILNEDVNLIPQTYMLDNVFDKDLNSKGVGVWNFPAKNAKYIEFILDQEESYDETLGTNVYMKGKADNFSDVVLIPEKDVPADIVKGPVGKYTIADGYIVKDVKAFDGLRLCIGIRDVSVYGYKFGTKSELVSRQYVSSKPITSVSLLVNEVIPDEFLTDLTKANDWIQYFISIDDINWTRISPISHKPYSNAQMPPKLITINQAGNDNMLNVKNLTSEKDVYVVRFKAVFSRPTGAAYEMITPVLEDYALRCTVL